LSSSESFYWHDYETSGADPAVDRPLQFAGVRTDADLNVIGEPLVQFAAPTPDYLPHPGAIRVTGIKPSEALAHGIPEREFIAKVHRELAAPGTCGVGYNSIRFDDEITRFALYRNFFDPYGRERNQGRSRWDLIDVVRAQAALRPEGMVWPRRDDGAISFRLEHLTAANGIEHGSAHDALADVLATVDLARQLKAAQPALFSALYAVRSAPALAPLLDPAPMRPVIHVSAMWGAQRHNLAVIVPLAFHPRSRNEIICADLAAKPDFLDLQRGDCIAIIYTSGRAARGHRPATAYQRQAQSSPGITANGLVERRAGRASGVRRGYVAGTSERTACSPGRRPAGLYSAAARDLPAAHFCAPNGCR